MNLNLTLAVASLIVVAQGQAGIIVLAGDSNLGNSINGTNGALVPADNGIFFSNLLGAGTHVAFQQTPNTDNSEVNSQAGILSYYGGLAGVTVNSFSGEATTAQLTGQDLFISFLHDSAFSTAETSAIASFLNAGGTVLFTGEWFIFDPAVIASVNAELAILGPGSKPTFICETG